MKSLPQRAHGAERRHINDRVAGAASMSFQRIAVLGGGAWGTALALTCARAGREVTLWEFDAENAGHLSAQRESKFLPGVKLDEGIKVTRDLAETAGAEAILL